MLTQHSQEPGSIPRKKQSALQAGSPARVQGRAFYRLPGPVSPTLLAGEPTGRRPERQAQGTRTSVGGEAASPGRGAGAGAALPGIRRVGRRGGAPCLTPRGGRWAEQGAPAGRVPNGGLHRCGPGWQPWRGAGSELGWGTRNGGENHSGAGIGGWGDRDSGSSSRQRRADLRGRKVSRVCAPAAASGSPPPRLKEGKDNRIQLSGAHSTLPDRRASLRAAMGVRERATESHRLSAVRL